MSIKAVPSLVKALKHERDWRVDAEVLSYFPEISPGVIPTGARVLCQLMSQKTVSAGGLILVEETKETERWNMQVARVLAVGDLAFCNRETGAPWREGAWCEPGDFVIIPRWGGQRRTVTGPHDEKVFFATVNDHEIIEKVFGNPLKLESFYL